MSVPLYLSACLSAWLLSLYLLVIFSVCLDLNVCWSVCLSICLSPSLSAGLPGCLSVCTSLLFPSVAAFLVWRLVKLLVSKCLRRRGELSSTIFFSCLSRRHKLYHSKSRRLNGSLWCFMMPGIPPQKNVCSISLSPTPPPTSKHLCNHHHHCHHHYPPTPSPPPHHHHPLWLSASG